MVKKVDFTLNIELNLFYIIFIGRVVPCQAGLSGPTIGPY
jgi:hypothetical protein